MSLMLFLPGLTFPLTTWAFAPYWIMLDAKKKNINIDSEKISIYHLDLNQKINNSNPEKNFILDKQGEVITVVY
ncbi:hypothetical protein [Hymenobacter fastidiosus]